MKKSIIAGALTFVAFIVLVSLGTWQVKRLAWKNALIEQLESRVKQSPIALQAAIDRFVKDGDVEYLPVKIRGTFLHDTEKHLYALNQQGRPGWHIYTLLETEGSDCKDCPNQYRYVYVNRGFVPYELKNSDKRPKGRGSSKVEFVGLIRKPQIKKSYSDADNRPLKNQWYWPSLKEMSLPSAGISNDQLKKLAPLFIDERAPSIAKAKSYKWPQAGVTKLNIANRHLGYVITWYGLALALLGVYGFFLKGRKQQSIEDDK